MPTKSTDTQKIKELKNLYDIIEITLTRDDAEPIVYKGRPKWMGGDGNIKLDKEREEEREIQLHRKYDERVRLAISIWETYRDCSEPPMSNPSPKIGLHELKAWAMKELKKEVCKNDDTNKQEKSRQGKPTSGGDKARDIRESTTLQQFFEDHCDLSQKPDIESKREMLLREYRAGRIKLPLVGKKKDYRRGQTYLFWLDKLLDNWPKYRVTLTTLPPLKRSGNK